MNNFIQTSSKYADTTLTLSCCKPLNFSAALPTLIRLKLIRYAIHLISRSYSKRRYSILHPTKAFERSSLYEHVILRGDMEICTTKVDVIDAINEMVKKYCLCKC